MNSTQAFEVVDTVYEPGTAKQVHYRPLRDKTTYKVWLKLKGHALPYVKGVTYKLHPTFVNRVHFVPRTPANPNCSLPIWTWGLFDVEAEVETKGGEKIKLVHPLGYDRQLAEAGIHFKED